MIEPLQESTVEKDFYKEAFDRNKGLISAHLQEKLKNTRIAICGLGGVGEVHAETLARLGIGKFTIADGDTFELTNTNRQLEAMSSTLGLSKTEVISRNLLDINPFAHVQTFGYITPKNVDDFLEGVDIFVDGIDFFELDIRRLIFNKAREKGIPVITAAPVGFGSSVIVFTQDSMNFDTYFNIHDDTPDEIKPYLFGIGLTPSLLQRSYYAPGKINMSTKTAPSSVLGTLAATNWVGTLVYKILEGKKFEVAPVSLHFDPYVEKVKKTKLLLGNKHPFQRFKLWYLKRTMPGKKKQSMP